MIIFLICPIKIVEFLLHLRLEIIGYLENRGDGQEYQLMKDFVTYVKLIYHYIMICDYFKDLRKKLRRQYYIKHPNTIKFFELMNNQNKKTIVNLCAFRKVIVKTTPAFSYQF